MFRDNGNTLESKEMDGRDLREHLIHSLHFPDEMKMRQMENLAQSHTHLTSKSIMFPKNILHGGKWSIILVGLENKSNNIY